MRGTIIAPSSGELQRGRAMLPIEDWDETYVTNVVARETESQTFEKKASTKFSQAPSDRDELAKQICAFANAGLGVLVYGINDGGGGLDPGVPSTVGRQSIADWVAGHLPRWHQPLIQGVKTRHIHFVGHHAPD